MAYMKFCPRCNTELIPQHEKYCSKCSTKIKMDTQEERRIYFKEYNENRKDINEFYNSKKWKVTRELAKLNDYNLCLICFSKGILKECDLVHHIVEVKEDMNLALNLDNLICLCNSCHRKVHVIYDSDDKSKREMILLLKKIKDSVIK